ncbi:catalase [Metarhizium album ARSEF 1941]|uniref:Catalase n=1 Tax=Metarhizium album (strain ARSEF 1941) TaxID=1081103 RepID=A0A0B2WDV8_METAS|nr:catalase [Metarhizium album ARSEF 1941]KHN94061.1 catalase [Metarhizium album ARSEF 1941]
MAAGPAALPPGASAAPSDPIQDLPQKLVDQMTTMFGYHAGYRTTHAKGLLVEGSFKPSAEAKSLSTAPHFHNPSTPIIARFSVGGGIPSIPDADNQATPKGVAIRFLIDDKTHTDMVTHSFNGFATRNGQDFLTFLKLFFALAVAKKRFDDAARKGGDASKEQVDLKQAKGVFDAWLGTHESAKRFFESPKPNPVNYGTITYYQPNTHVLTNAEGETVNVRYRLDPVDGEQLFPENEAPKQPNYLEDNLLYRFPTEPIKFKVLAHIAGPDDVLDDATVPYKSTRWVPVGDIDMSKVAEDNANKQQQLAFSPAPESGGVRGIKSSNDPLIQTRKGVYYISSKQRREAKREPGGVAELYP